MKTMFDKYNVPGPRYTSYPTVPHWKGLSSAEVWKYELMRRIA